MKIPARLFYERLLLAVIAGLFCAALSWFEWSRPLDRLIYDIFNEAAPLPVAGDIVVVAIDDNSLRELGRWPWPRENHVQLLRRLREEGVAAVAIDLVFAEPYHDYPDVDGLMAGELRQLGTAVLPLFIARAGPGPGGGLREVLPIEPLASSAAGVGHVHIDVDHDGVTRTVYLREGLGEARWPHFSVALARVVGSEVTPLPGVSDDAVLKKPDPRAIIRSHANLIPFMGAAGTIPRVSYVDVMKGRLPAGSLRGKIVFVGATAAGQVDNVTTSLGQIPGVEINASIFHALRSGQLARPIGRVPSALLAFAVISLSVFIITRLPPGRLLLAVLGGAVCLPLASFLLLQYARLWASPAPMMLTLLFAYPLWNWLRLAAAVDFIQAHLSRLEQENSQWSFQDPTTGAGQVHSADPVDAIMQQLDFAYAEARHNHALVRDTLEQLASGVLLAEASGRVLLANDESRELLGLQGAGGELRAALETIELEEGLVLDDLLGGLSIAGDHFNCEGIAVPSGKDILLRGGVIGSGHPLHLFVMTDISELKQSERRRAEALNFLSHDLRAPLISVLALIEGSRDEHGAAGSQLLKEIEKYIRANLSYAENFIQLARLEQAAMPRFDECEARSLLDNAVAQLYHSAASRDISLSLSDENEELWLSCGRDLVERVLINLIDNALKHSADGAQVDLGLGRDGSSALFTVCDQGPGIAAADMQRIFEQFEQGRHARTGVGLGLRFVSAVARVHGGSITVANNTGPGCTFTLALPLKPA